MSTYDDANQHLYLLGLIEHMRLQTNDAGDLKFPHLDYDCLEAIGKIWRKDWDDFRDMTDLEAIEAAYHRAVRTCHPRIH